MHVCAKHAVKHASLGNFDFGPFIRHNLVESGTVFTPVLGQSLHV